jgi:hypothetical protein
MEQYMYTYLN